MLWSFWVIFAAILFVVEIITPGVFFFACLGIGALIAALAAYLNLPYGLPWLVFILASLASIYTIRPIARRFFQQDQHQTNIDALIGKTAWVTEGIHPPETGIVKVDGELWRAQAQEPLEAGVPVEVLAVRGTRLEVRKSETK